ncbi:MAG: patatin-like phospholipase family protein [Spirochaetales bacterium]
MSQRRAGFGLALGGGAARGVAHIGVLRVLEEEGLEPDFICGTSAGSIVGALYAGGYRWETIAEVVRSTDWRDIVQPVFPKMGLVKAEKLQQRLNELLDSLTFEELDVPFCAVAVDIMTGKKVQLRTGPVAPAVRASCSVPGIFEPMIDGDRVLVDGGILEEVPIYTCQDMGAKIVLAVDLNSDLATPRFPENVFHVILASFAAISRNREKLAHSRRNVVVALPKLAEFSFHDLKRREELIEAGAAAVREELPRLKKLLRMR